MGRRHKMIAFEGVDDSIEDHSINAIEFDDALRLFLESLAIRGLRSATLTWHRRNLNDFANTLRKQAIVPIPAEMSKDVIQQNYIKYCIQERELDPVTINGRITSLRQFFKWLYDESYIKRNPMLSVQKLRQNEKVPYALSRDQVRQVLGKPDLHTFVGLRDYTMMSVMVDCGLRLKEIKQLTVEDIDLQNRTLLVRDPKNRRDRRVPFQRQVAQALVRWLNVRGTIPGEDRVFVSYDNDGLSSKGIQDRIKRYASDAGITKVRVSPHTFRHTFARLYIENGGDPYSLQQILGHSSQDMVAHYVRFWGMDLVRQHARFSPIASLKKVD